MKENNLSVKEHEKMNKLFTKIVKQEWIPESCIQEFYSEFFVSHHYNFYHRGHEYFITFDYDELNQKQWVIYDRDLTNEKYKNNTVWGHEPKETFPDLPTLSFEFNLKNDGRTILEYICDYNHVNRLLMAVPVNEKEVCKIWKH